MAAVSDTSPLILLTKVDSLDLLRVVFSDILIPRAVGDEIRSGHSGRVEMAVIEATSWIQIRSVPLGSGPRILPVGLGAGEREAIALAMELGRETTLILDDRPARRAAAGLGLPHVGTVGILIQAKERGAIREIRTVLDKLRTAGMYLSEQEYRRALSLAGE